MTRYYKPRSEPPRSDWIIIVPVVIFALAIALVVGWPILNRASERAVRTQSSVLPKLQELSKEVEVELRTKLPERHNVPAPDVAVSIRVMFAESIDEEELSEDRRINLSSTDDFFLRVRYVRRSEFSEVKKLVGEALARHGLKEIEVRPFVNYIDTKKGERLYQRKWDIGNEEWNSVVVAEPDRPLKVGG